MIRSSRATKTSTTAPPPMLTPSKIPASRRQCWSICKLKSTTMRQTPQNPAAISTRKTTNLNLVAIIKETDEILSEQMDRLIELFCPDHPDFVQTYESTRIIVDPPTKPKKPKDTAS